MAVMKSSALIPEVCTLRCDEVATLLWSNDRCKERTDPTLLVVCNNPKVCKLML